MTQKWTVPALSGIAIVFSLAWFLWARTPNEPQAGAATPVPPPSQMGPDTLRYAEGAPQLTMIRSQPLAPSRVPLGDVLSARVAYDEDATARIGVGVSGRIVEIKAAPGDAVKAGQVLAEIDSPDFGTAAADLRKARADEERKRLAVERARDLVSGDAIPVKEWESLQSDLAQAGAETLRAEQRLRNLNPRGLPISGQRVKLTSPIDGVVTDRSATPALEVSPGSGTPLFVVTDPKRLWLMIDLPEKLLGRVRLGSDVSVESDAFPGEQFAARVVQLGQVIDTNTRRATVRAVLDNRRLALLPEMFVRARVLQPEGTGVRVPNGAIVNHGLYAYLFVQETPGEFRRRKVALITQGADASYVGEGLRGGEQVVVKGALLLDAELTARAGDKS
ncbi:cobalt-zinc-cadmium efflux system membrane fusion protein [Variovorax sp. 1140]|uniref:efflux RND transporter periplasmic adaptor subunit n=1 Tax=Variovorax atrisoli TaxID=3394203 RepID=UPI0033967692